MSPHSLPPLKFHAGLIQPHSLLAPRLGDSEDDEGNNYVDESVASVSDDMDLTYSDEDDEHLRYCNEAEEEETFGYKSSNTKLNRGLLNSLKIEVPESNQRFTDGDLGIQKSSHKTLTPSAGSSISSLLRERVQLRNAQVRI